LKAIVLTGALLLLVNLFSSAPDVKGAVTSDTALTLPSVSGHALARGLNWLLPFARRPPK
jgi:hypothetical protein